MVHTSFSLADQDPKTVALLEKTDHKTIAIWAIDCAERVLPYFTTDFPNDPRPRLALQSLQEWIRTGTFSMATIRHDSLAAHTAAREVGADTPARSAARAAGQAVATAHVRTHGIGAAMYALQAIYRNSKPEELWNAIEQEKEWQYQKLVDRIKESHSNSGVRPKK